MACNVGQRLQYEFDKAVAVRAEFEAGTWEGIALLEAKIKESSASRRRAVHVRHCAECCVNPPRRRDDVNYEGLMAAGLWG